MAKTLLTKSWNKERYEKVETFRTVSLCFRDFSLHCYYCFDVDGWSVGLGWLQLSWGTFSRPVKSIESQKE
ncbi:hypothetical protein [Vibrio sp. TRT 29B02]|uniref:hypothetical protein n=1 Tax=Vibrio sp. TRT 29B02 TaxID=3418508 RepID=UPI003CFA0011